MRTITGKSVCEGIAVGRIRFLPHTPRIVRKHVVGTVETELERFAAAVAQAEKELGDLHRRAMEQVGDEEAAVFAIHAMMLEDEDFLAAIRDGIRLKSWNAEYAVKKTANAFSNTLATMDTPRSWSPDVADVAERLMACLSGEQTTVIPADAPCILAARDLPPSRMIGLDRRMILALILSEGTTSSHTALFAKTMGLAMVVQCGGVDEMCDGVMAAVDAYSGTVHIDPDAALLKTLDDKETAEKEKLKNLRQYRGKTSTTLDGRCVPLYANINSLEDLDAARHNGAEGIGLFRSEFLCLDDGGFPDEESQFAAYRAITEAMAGNRTIVRTFDFAVDKHAAALDFSPDENSALGLRGIRLCLERPDMFLTQLRALYRASVHGGLAIMFPMVSTVMEVRAAKSLATRAREELAGRDQPFNESMEIGIMIETPAAAVTSDELADEADFFSIGTNDLLQYTLAADRHTMAMAKFYDPRHNALMRLIGLTVRTAHDHGIPVCVCGDLAGDETATVELLRMGVDQLSVPPRQILPLKKRICEIDLSW